MTQPNKVTPLPNHYSNGLPTTIGGYQHIVHGPTAHNDIWVHDGLPRSFVDTNEYTDADMAEEAHGRHGWHIYRKMPVPSNRHDDPEGVYPENIIYKNGADETSKPTNPKDIMGSNKIPMHLFPTTAKALGALALLDGALKYGRTNYRAIGVRSSIYYDATNRHLDAWFEGEDNDPDSGLPHLAHALACIAVIVDAQAAGKLNDDRVYPGDYRKFMEAMTPFVKALKAKHEDKTPRHYTKNDLTPAK